MFLYLSYVIGLPIINLVFLINIIGVPVLQLISVRSKIKMTEKRIKILTVESKAKTFGEVCIMYLLYHQNIVMC